MTRITRAVHKGVFSFITFRWVFLRMGNVPDKSCTESQNTYFTFNYFFRKSCRLWDNVKKIWYSQTDHRWQYNAANALCMLDK